MARDRRTQGRKPKALTPTQQAKVHEGKNAADRRRRWETGPVGSERMQGTDARSAAHLTTSHGAPSEVDAARGAPSRIPIGMQYELNRWGEAGQAESGHPRMYDRQLPGLEDPLAAPTPPRWDELSPAKQTEYQRNIKAVSGATFESMENAFGAQLDQSYVRAEREGVPRVGGEVRPRGQDFYSAGEPKQVIRRTAQEHGVPQQLVAAMHGDNSPNTSFQRPDPNDPTKSVYPQDVMTRSALEQIQGGALPSQVQRPPRAEGYTANFEKSAGRAHGVLYEGKSMAESGGISASTGEPKSGMGMKTAAYTNSWTESQPDFFVSDVHSGGAMIPHQSTAKPPRYDADGNMIMQTVTRGEGTVDVPKREKSEREKTIERAGFHSMADEAARRALAARGLGSVRQAQAAQWNEERIQRFGEHRSYDPAERNSLARRRPQIPGQEELF